MQKLLMIMGTVALLAVAGCGGDDDDGNGGGADAAGNNAAPTASFTSDKSCTTSSSDAIAFTSTSTDPDDDTLTCSWTFASGTPASSSDCEVTGVTFPNAAPYDVTLVVDDGNGGSDSETVSIPPCT